MSCFFESEIIFVESCCLRLFSVESSFESVFAFCCGVMNAPFMFTFSGEAVLSMLLCLGISREFLSARLPHVGVAKRLMNVALQGCRK